MRILTSLLCKVTLSSMIVTAPSITGISKDGVEKPYDKDLMQPYYSSAVIKKFVNYSSLTAVPVYSEVEETNTRIADVRRIHIAAARFAKAAVGARVVARRILAVAAGEAAAPAFAPRAAIGDDVARAVERHRRSVEHDEATGPAATTAT